MSSYNFWRNIRVLLQLLKRHSCPLTTFEETFVSSYNFWRDIRVLLQLLKRHSCPLATFEETYVFLPIFEEAYVFLPTFEEASVSSYNFCRNICVLLQLLKRHSCPLTTFEETFVFLPTLKKHTCPVTTFVETFVSSYNFCRNIRVLLQLL